MLSSAAFTVSYGRVGLREPTQAPSPFCGPVRAVSSRASAFRVAFVAILGAGLSLGSTACTSSPVRSLAGTSTVATSTTPASTQSATAAPVGLSTTSEVSSAEQLPVKQALGVLRQLFVLGGLDPDDQHTASVRLRACPLGQPRELTATPPALVAGLSASAVYTMNRSPGPVLDIICRFSNAAPAGATTSAPGSSTSAEVQYDASYVPPDQLKPYLRFLDDRGFVQRPERFIDGVVYDLCSAADGSTTTVGTTSSSCSALWYFRQLVIGVQFRGSGKPVDVTAWLTSVVPPIIQSLAKTEPTAVETPATTSTTASASTTTSG